MSPARLSPSPFPVIALLTLAVWLQPLAAAAHGELSERIAKLSAQITAQPTNASLLLQRAELFRQHHEFDAALLDLATAARAKADERAVLLAQAHVFSDAGQTTNALAAAENFLALEPDHPGALVMRARCQLKLSRPHAAIADFTRAIATTKTPEPDLFLERARAQAAAGQLASAVSGLDEGMARVGAVPALQLAAIGYERQRAAFTNALTRVDKILAGQTAQEPWLVLRGEILAQAGRLDEARTVFQQALDGIQQYPPARRNLELTRQLETRVRENLGRLQARQLSAR